MDVYNEIRKAFDELGEHIDVIDIDRNRMKFPEAGYMAESNNGHSVFVLRYNTGSLIRWAIWEIVLHEVTHKKLREEGYEAWKEHDETFWRKYAELRKVVENKIAEIYGW